VVSRLTSTLTSASSPSTETVARTRDLAGKTALVTGGSRGIGRAIVETLAAAGADVAFGYRENAEAANDVKTRAEALGARCITLPADLASDEAPAELVEQTMAHFGRLDILVANAASWQPIPFLDTPVTVFDHTLAVNTRATFLLMQQAARKMVDGGRGGRIVVLTSRAARRPRPGTAAYSASKAAVITLAHSAAIELAEFGITVNEVAPGPNETEMNTELRADPVLRQGLLDFILLKRFGQPEDVAAAVRFLVSDDASYITGCTLPVDGGGSIG
jgi:3-oxoacyl-[acyl-carrier protein] reductase